MAEPSKERLDELGERIDKARRDAEEDGLLPDTTPERSFIDPDADAAEDAADDAGEVGEEHGAEDGGEVGEEFTDDSIAPG